MSDPQSSLFLSMSKDGVVPKSALIDAFAQSGIQDDDLRCAKLLKRLRASDDMLTHADFQALLDCSPALFEQLLSGQLAIPQFKAFSDAVGEIFEQVAQIEDGKLADYIPQLQRVDPGKFAVSACSIDGQRI